MKHNALVLTAELHRQHATALGHFMAGPTGQHLFLLACIALLVIVVVSGIGKAFRSS